jgi:hypothetical protein
MTAAQNTTQTKPQSHLRTCKRCALSYDWRRSPSSSLKMTYCGSLCEQADLGFTLEALLRMPPVAVKPAEPVEPQDTEA